MLNQRSTQTEPRTLPRRVGHDPPSASTAHAYYNRPVALGCDRRAREAGIMLVRAVIGGILGFAKPLLGTTVEFLPPYQGEG